MDLRAYGIYYYPIIGANDINSAKQGRWSFNSSTNELELFDMEMNSIVKFKIEKLERRLLRLIRVTN
jgi:murein L,D-transpeptidase YafK